jgi:ribonucleoside-diphosphate reductase alpha chain
MIGAKQSFAEFSSGKIKPAEKSYQRDVVSNTSKRTKRGATAAATPSRKGLVVSRVFSKPSVHPFDELAWERRTAEITDDAGKVIFRQDDVEVPTGWSVLATKVVVSKYFYGELGTPERETSVRQLVHRVSRTIADWGQAQGYFASEKDAETFYNE